LDSQEVKPRRLVEGEVTDDDTKWLLNYVTKFNVKGSLSVPKNVSEKVAGGLMVEDWWLRKRFW